MKRFLTLCLIVLAVLYALPGCGCGGDIEAGLVFVNQSDAVIVEVVVQFQDRSGGTRFADSSPLDRGNSFGFEAGEYPATVYVYDKAVGDVAEGALAQLTIQTAPPEGGRWYVTARDGAAGLTLLTSARLPEPEEAVAAGRTGRVCLAFPGKLCYHRGKSIEKRCGHDPVGASISHQLQGRGRGAVLPAARGSGAVREDRPIL